ncbi:MAG TPA: low-specificity L-threonine aldolase [Phycisphaerae bacterium]|nr:low-specificity L-threonine aldolase [Phycisphaerae bacterium]
MSNQTESVMIDLRSDTVTQPTPAMKEAMMRAPLGDDIFSDDPTVNALQDRVADMFGMEAALFVPSGTMANQVAIRSHTEPGDEIICHPLSHIYLYEAGAPAALSGCSVRFVDGARGMFTSDDVRAALRPVDQHFPVSRLCVIENTQNRGGGSVWSESQIADVSQTARELGLKMHLDGARIMNACVASGTSPKDYAKHFDSATICFSKGLGAPVGSAVAGSKAFITRARRIRKMFGGAMRQSGILAAAANYALDHHVERLKEDHENAATLAKLLSENPRIKVDPCETNIVYFDLDKSAGTAPELEAKLLQNNVRMLALGPARLRAVTHLHVTNADIDRAATIILNLIR